MTGAAARALGLFPTPSWEPGSLPRRRADPGLACPCSSDPDQLAQRPHPCPALCGPSLPHVCCLLPITACLHGLAYCGYFISMESYTISSFATGLFHSAMFLGSSHVAACVFHLFSLPNCPTIFHGTDRPYFIVCLSVASHWGEFHGGAAIDNAAVDICVQDFVF